MKTKWQCSSHRDENMPGLAGGWETRTWVSYFSHILETHTWVTPAEASLDQPTTSQNPDMKQNHLVNHSREGRKKCVLSCATQVLCLFVVTGDSKPIHHLKNPKINNAPYFDLVVLFINCFMSIPFFAARLLKLVIYWHYYHFLTS